MKKKLISIVSPCLNEEENLSRQFERISQAISPYREKYDFEHIYTDNCSSDKSFEVLEKLAAINPTIKAIRFSNNIGYNRSIFMGLKYSKGDAVVLIQSDLQDPPEMIPDFIREWENGYDVVYGQIMDRDENYILKSSRELFYYLIDSFSEISVPRNAGDFRLMSRRSLDALMRYQEDDPYIRGAIARIGFKQLALPYNRFARTHGKSNFRLFYLLSYAINGFVSTTIAPIRIVSLLGVTFAVLGFVLTLLTVLAKFFIEDFAPPGYASIACLITFFSGLQLLGIGIIGEYLRKTYLQTLKRPLGFVEKSINFDTDSLNHFRD